jgi:ABC-type uncharacterized transport system fused permease/ATPase subunit
MDDRVERSCPQHERMFWAALLYAVVGSWLTHVIGRRLIPLSNQQER